jgi:hypothetical protein
MADIDPYAGIATAEPSQDTGVDPYAGIATPEGGTTETPKSKFNLIDVINGVPGSALEYGKDIAGTAQNVGQSWLNRASNIRHYGNTPIPDPLDVVGAGAGSVGDIVGGGLTAAGKVLGRAFPGAAKSTTEMLTGLFKGKEGKPTAIGGAVGGLGKTYDVFKQDNPGMAHDLEDVANIVSMGLVKPGVSIAKGAVGAATKEEAKKQALNILTKIVKAPESGMSGIGKATSAWGSQTANAIIRPGKIGQREGFNIDNMFKHDLIGKNIDEMKAKTDAKLSGLHSQLDAIKEAGEDAGVQVDLMDAINKTRTKITSGKINVYDKGKAGVLLDEIEARLWAESDAGKVSLPEAMRIKTDTGQKGAWFQREGGAHADPEAPVKDQVFNSLYPELKNNINKVIKDNNLGNIEAINKQYEELIPISRAIERRVPIIKSNNPLSPTDYLAGGTGLLGAGGVALGIQQSHGKTPDWLTSTVGGLGGALTMIALNKIGKAPLTGKLLYNLGKGIDKSAPYIARPAVGAGTGAAVGSQTGATDEERRRNAVIGAMLGLAGGTAMTPAVRAGLGRIAGSKAGTIGAGFSNGDMITDGLIRGKIVGEGSIKFGKNQLPAYKVEIVGGREGGHTSLIAKDDAKALKETGNTAIPMLSLTGVTAAGGLAAGTERKNIAKKLTKLLTPPPKQDDKKKQDYSILDKK